MENLFRSLAYKILPDPVISSLRSEMAKRRLKQWVKNGKQRPIPHIVKINTITEYQKKYGYKIFVETGTYLGDMVEAQKKRFNKIISIELGKDLFMKAKERFMNDSNVQLIQGDSGTELPKVVSDLKEPAIFWLDGHYSGGITAKSIKECPIIEELEAVLTSSHKYPHVVLIDDAFNFTGTGDYPAIEELISYIKNGNNKYRISVIDDIIRCTIS